MNLNVQSDPYKVWNDSYTTYQHNHSNPFNKTFKQFPSFEEWYENDGDYKKSGVSVKVLYRLTLFCIAFFK